jgi:hypothetical protein
MPWKSRLRARAESGRDGVEMLRSDDCDDVTRDPEIAQPFDHARLAGRVDPLDRRRGFDRAEEELAL